MSSNDKNTPLSGIQAAGAAVLEKPNKQSEKDNTMKRAHAKQMIEQYYYQLTDGCGSSDCTNDCCASCPSFRFSNTDRNKLAVQAIELFQTRAVLCQHPSKKTRIPMQESGALAEAEEADSAHSIQPSTSSPDQPTAAIVSAIPKKPSSETLTFLTEAKLKEIIAQCREEGTWPGLIRAIGNIFNNPDSVRQSFLKENAEDITSVAGLKFPIQETRPEPGSDATPSLRTGEEELKLLTLDLASLRRAVDALMAIEDHPFQSALNNALCLLSNTMDMNLRYHGAYTANPDYVNIVLTVFEIPLVHTPEFIEDCLPAFCQACRHLPLAAHARLARIWSTFGESRLRDLLQVLQQLITVRVIKNEGQWNQNHHINDDEGIVGATRMMKTVYYASLLASERDNPAQSRDESAVAAVDLDDVFGFIQGAVGEEQRKEPLQEKVDPLARELGVQAIDVWHPVIPFEEFINDPLNESLGITTDYAYYRAENDVKFSFVNHNFILTTASKQTSMYYDNRIRMLNERRTSLFQTLVHGAPPMPFLKVKVRRDHVVEDALVVLEMVAMENPADLKKQLFVEFEGEQGLDEGGVSKEFFQLIVEELFNPDIGMFTHREDTGQYWFNPTSFENDAQFTLIGILFGLAIYNSCILNIQFPMVVYRKLMGKRGTLRDLTSVDPTLASSLQQLQAYEGDDLEEVFMQSFHISYCDVFGSILTHELKENGKDTPVTQANKREFVELYSDFLLNKSIERQFKAFRRGFVMVTNESPLKLLFRPDEVEMLVCGSRVLDFLELERATEYDGGFCASSPTILNFWEVVHGFSEEQKRKLLQFTTGTDRVPVGGLAKLKLIIARNGSDSDRLPTSHTCFNVLLLPDYSSKDKLQERLLKAINYAKGFGML